jgi:CheY-specific phosphatase CheX
MSMKFAENELRQITEDTWKIVLGEELQLLAGPMSAKEIPDAIATCAQITGDWELAVVLYGSAKLARNAATAMFGADETDMTMDDIHDAMCELINIIAGNVKGILSGSTHLALPNLVKGNDFKLTFPRHVLLSEAHFHYRDEPVLVMLLGEDKLASRKGGRLEAKFAGRPVRDRRGDSLY